MVLSGVFKTLFLLLENVIDKYLKIPTCALLNKFHFYVSESYEHLYCSKNKIISKQKL